MAFTNLSLYQPRMRFPNWYRPNSRTMELLVIIEIGANSASLSVPQFTISEPEVRRAVGSCLQQAGLVFTPGLESPRTDAAIAELVVSAVMFEVARNHFGESVSDFIPYIGLTTADGRRSLQLVNFWGPDGEPNPRVGFALTARQYAHPFNAFSAAKAWHEAPWASSSMAEIVYDFDPTLPVLSSQLVTG